MLPARRNLSAGWRFVARCLALALPLSTIVYAFQLLPAAGIVIYKEQFLVWFLTIALMLAFLLVPARRPAASGRPPEHADRHNSNDAHPVAGVPWYDCLLAVAVAGAGGYTTFRYAVLLPEIGLLTADKIVVSAVAIVALLEAARRVAGSGILAVGVSALAYAYFGHLLGGVLETRVIRLDRLVLYNYMGQDAIHGTPLFVAATIVAAFMLFGQILFATGAGQAISDFGFALLGRRRGGPAKVSVAASAAFGSLSGSASANVATTGLVTIPMIRENGYPAHKAAAIEAVASTGGLILPPIMAATGFIMAEFLGIAYIEVAKAALLPALLFYFGLFVQVDLEAARLGMTGVKREELPPLGKAMRSIVPVLLPVIVLLWSLFGRFQSPESSALLAAGTTVLMGLALPAMRRSLREYVDVLIATGESIVYIAIVCAIAGLVVGCLGLTGLGSNLSAALVELASGQVWLLVALAALGSIVLGMGVPVTATYVILVILIGPALIGVGIPALSAHMFLFYFGTLSFLTPPVCISVFVAAALAGAAPMATALVAMRLAIVAYVIPFFFLFEPGYLLVGTSVDLIRLIIAAVAGVYLLSAGLAGFIGGPLSLWARLALAAAGVATLYQGPKSWLLAVLAGAAIPLLARLNRPRLGPKVE